LPKTIAQLLDEAAQHEASGAWGAALGAYEEALRTTVSGGLPKLQLDVQVRIGHCHRKAGNWEAAAEQFGMGLDLGSKHGDQEQIGRALNGLGLVAQARGRLTEAESLYRGALECAARSGSRALEGHVHQNLGIIANIRGDLPEAVRLYSLGIELLEEAGNDDGVSAALNNLAILHVTRGELDEAEACYDRAEAICRRTNNVHLIGIMKVNRAELYIARGDLARAREVCDAGFEILGEAGDTLRQAEALKYYGIIYRLAGKPHLASIHLQRSIDIAAPRDPLLEAQAQRELALVLRELGRNRDALAALNRSHTLFTELQAQTDTADIQERIDRLETDFLVLVQQWGESIEAKDRYTVGHCLRVADYACRLAEKVGIAPHEMVWFRMGAFLHDLGKIEVPEEVLNKPGRLTDEERALMERHPVTGEAMLGSVDFPWDIRPMVRSHHERWDGGGYPDRLVGEAIPFSARILRVADVFDALTTARSYRRPLTPAEAMAIMVEDQGSFDAQIFAAFQELFPELSVTAEQASSIYPA
jgi:putative nucleotidyltransferase with HDIG domain